MNQLLRMWRVIATALVAAFLLAVITPPQAAFAGTTGNITGTVTDAAGKPVADVRVSAASPSQSAATTTNSSGFFTLVNLTPDTYTVSFQKQGFQANSVPGVTVQQDLNATVNHVMQPELKTIAAVRASGSSNLLKPNQGSDVYTVSGAQLKAATNPLGTHETLYQWLAVTPGVTGTGFPSQPRVRGGQVTDLGYEFEGVPIQDRITGFFTTNLSNVGLSNVEVYTGGLPASGSTNGTGYFNSVLKTGTYPGFYTLAYQATSPEANQFLTFEYGGASLNRKLSYYVAFSGVNSQNQYDYGEKTYPNVLLYGFDGPGPVRTRDWVSNFHYRPDPKNDVQFVLTNSLGEFDFNYLLNKGSGEPPALALQPCPGAVANPNTATGGSGGVAPNGQACPNGMYFSPLSNGTGNIWHHYGGVGKLQWNHNLNDHSFFDLRFAENFNQYIFDQPVADPNIPSLENNPYYNWAANLPGGSPNLCPAYPYAAGTPVLSPTGHAGDLCAADDGIEVFYGDRNSKMYIGSLDYTNAINANINLRSGVSHEIDYNTYNYYLTNSFNSNGTWPNNYLRSIYPTTRDEVYADSQIHFGRLMIDPGVAFAQEHYGYPNGGKTQSVVNPVFNGTFTFNPSNVVRFSYGNTASFVGTGYVYRENSGRYNPNKAGFAFAPQINHSADLMFEHDFGDNTTLRVGPWYNKTSNYFESYRPIISTNPFKLGPSVLSNAQAHNAFGAEFALNHIDNHAYGTSWWLSATYDNFWTTSYGLAGSFINTPLPQNLINQGVFVRATENPLLSGTLLADFHSDRFHLAPLLYYQEGTFYNIGHINYSGPTPQIDQNELIASGYWKASLTAYEELGPKHTFVAGFKVDNLFDNRNDVAPCSSDGTGCFPFNGPSSGINGTPGNIYQDYSQSPRLFYFFLGVKT